MKQINPNSNSMQRLWIASLFIALSFLCVQNSFAQASDLFISEYGEGSSGSSKYIEIYNGTGSDVDLSDYAIWRISNGGSWYEASVDLSGTLSNGDTYVIANNSSDVPGADQYSGTISHNGDDALGLAKSGTLIDAVGESGSDPGTGWSVAGTSNATKDHILTRKCDVTDGNTDWDDARGTSTSDSEWEVTSTYSTGAANAGHTTCWAATVPTAPTATTEAASDLTTISATLNATVDDNDAETTYYFEYGTLSGSYSTQISSQTLTSGSGSTSVTASLTGLTTDQTYYYRIVATNSEGTTYGDEVSFTPSLSYCSPSPSSVDNDGITNVSMGTIDNSTGTETDNYGDYSAQSTDVYQDATVSCDITYETSYTYLTKIWVDWNNDGDFDDTDEEVYSGESTSSNPTTLNASFTVPSDASLGSHRLRIGGCDSNTPTTCYTGTYGSYEDYTINVIASCSTDPGFAFSTTSSVSLDASINEAVTRTASSSTGSSGTIIYSSSDESVAVVDANTGEVTAIGNGTATITASIAGYDDYCSADDSYSVTVTGGLSASSIIRYQLVTAECGLTAGAKYLVVSPKAVDTEYPAIFYPITKDITNNVGYALGKEEVYNSSYDVRMTPQSVVWNWWEANGEDICTISDATIATSSTDDGAFPITLGGSSGSWTLYDELNGEYLYAGGSSYALNSGSSAYTWDISFPTFADEITGYNYSYMSKMACDVSGSNDILVIWKEKDADNETSSSYHFSSFQSQISTVTWVSDRVSPGEFVYLFREVVTLNGSISGCNGRVLTNTSVSGETYQLYKTDGTAVQSSQTGTGSSIIWSGLEAGDYYVVEGSSGCEFYSDTATVELTGGPDAPTVTVINDCGSSTLTASDYTGSLLWNNGETSQSITVSSSASYSVTQTEDGCTSSATVETISITPLETTWNGSTDTDWQTASNWSDGVPGACTNVIISTDGVESNYPVILEADSAYCNDITFEPETGVLGVQYLNYSRAFVQMLLDRDEWYTLKAPLKNMYSGDFFFSGAPVAYMRLFDAINPDIITSAKAEGTFTSCFANLGVSLDTINGFAFKMTSSHWDYPNGCNTITTDTTITFPRLNADSSLVRSVAMYSGVTGKQYSNLTTTLSKDSSFAYRFISESEDNKIPSEIKIPVKAGLNLIGNPLMSHLDFDEFWQDNNDKIEGAVKLWNGTVYTTVITASVFNGLDAAGYISSISTDISSLNIPPLESFFVYAKSDTNLVLKPAEHYVTDQTAKLRSSKTSSLSKLYVTADNGKNISSTLVMHNENAGNSLGNDDAFKLFSEYADVPELYTVAGSECLDINQFSTYPYSAPLCFHTDVTDSVKLSFDGAEGFEDVDVYLINTSTGDEIDLKDSSSYQLFVDASTAEGMLFIEFREASAVSEVSEVISSEINIYSNNEGEITVISSPSDKIKNVYVMDVLGRQVASLKDVDAASVIIPVENASAVYVVKVETENNSKEAKLIVK